MEKARFPDVKERGYTKRLKSKLEMNTDTFNTDDNSLLVEIAYRRLPLI